MNTCVTAVLPVSLGSLVWGVNEIIVLGTFDVIIQLTHHEIIWIWPSKDVSVLRGAVLWSVIAGSWKLSCLEGKSCWVLRSYLKGLPELFSKVLRHLVLTVFLSHLYIWGRGNRVNCWLETSVVKYVRLWLILRPGLIWMSFVWFLIDNLQFGSIGRSYCENILTVGMQPLGDKPVSIATSGFNKLLGLLIIQTLLGCLQVRVGDGRKFILSFHF